MNNILTYLTIIFLSTFAWADNHWAKKKTNFEQRIQDAYQRKTNKLKSKTKHIRYKQKLRLDKSKLKWALLENRLQRDNKDKAQKLLNLFINPQKKGKENIKRKFMNNKNKNKKLKEKYKIPLEEQLFL